MLILTLSALVILSALVKALDRTGDGRDREERSALLVVFGATLEPLKRALNASTAPLFESRLGGALDLLRRPGPPRTEIGNAPWEQYSKCLGQGHGIGLVARPRNAFHP